MIKKHGKFYPVLDLKLALFLNWLENALMYFPWPTTQILTSRIPSHCPPPRISSHHVFISPCLLQDSSTISWRHAFSPSPSVFKGLLAAILDCWCNRHKKVGIQPTDVDGHLLTFPHQATSSFLSMRPAPLQQNQFTQNKSNGLSGTVAGGRISRWIKCPSGAPVFFFFFQPMTPPPLSLCYVEHLF